MARLRPAYDPESFESLSGSIRLMDSLIADHEKKLGILRRARWEFIAMRDRPMTGFLATLTPEQRERALAYRGPDNHGRPDLPKALIDGARERQDAAARRWLERPEFRAALRRPMSSSKQKD